jgi:hypothetical protein
MIGKFTGLIVGLIAFQIGYLAQAAWLWWRSRRLFSDIQARDLQLIQTATSPETALPITE